MKNIYINNRNRNILRQGIDDYDLKIDSSTANNIDNIHYTVGADTDIDKDAASRKIAQDFYDDKDAIIMKYLGSDSITMYRGKEIYNNTKFNACTLCRR